MKSNINAAAILVALLVSACSSAALLVGVPPAGALPTASTGYATAGTDLDTANVTFTQSAPVINVLGGPSVSLLSTTIAYTSTSDPDVILAQAAGISFTLNRIGATNDFSGSNGNIDVFATVLGVSNDNQALIASFLVSDTSGTGTDFAQIGTSVFGFNTAPDVVAGRSGSATYTGESYLSMLQGSGGLSLGAGTATLTANFGSNTISGSMSLTDNGSDSGFAIGATTIAINPATITGNIFSAGLTIDPSQLNIGSMSGVTLDGMFYGTGGTTVGGSFSGTGLATNGTTLIYLQGGLLASQ